MRRPPLARALARGLTPRRNLHTRARSRNHTSTKIERSNSLRRVSSRVRRRSFAASFPKGRARGCRFSFIIPSSPHRVVRRVAFAHALVPVRAPHHHGFSVRDLARGHGHGLSDVRVDLRESGHRVRVRVRKSGGAMRCDAIATRSRSRIARAVRPTVRPTVDSTDGR